MTLHYSCVIKCIRKSQKSYVNFYYEANILKNLKNPIIPSLYDIQEDEKYYYLIEEFLAGNSLFSYNIQKKISYSEIISIIFQICDILEYLHMQKPEPILYLDLQPKNILIEKGKIKLIDFGSARKRSDLKNQKFFYGTLGFAAPEQYQGGLLSECTDIYSLGAVFYFLLTGLIPSSNTKLIEVPIKYQNIIKKCLYYNPEERYQSISEVKKEITQILFTESKNNQNSSFILSIAGMKSGIGVTHICFSFAKYLSKKQTCFYLEENSSNIIENLVKKERLRKREHGYLYKDFYLIKNLKEIKRIPKHSIIIKDYGVLTPEHKIQFQREEHKIIVMGIKPWENLEEPEGLEEALYLINFSDGTQFYEWQKKRKKGYRIPYMPNPFLIENKEFWEEIYRRLKN